MITMKIHRIITRGLIITLTTTASYTFAQSTATSLAPAPTNNPELLTSTVTVKAKHKKKNEHGIFSPNRQSDYKRRSYKHDARYEFYQRIEEAAKQKQRIIKELSKRQYSDPRYFGHKKIPKRRLPHKMRYCGECGIRH